MDDETLKNAVAVYAAAVRAQLSDLPQAEREALLEDLEDHLAEIAQESDSPLASRLGDPAAYAAELRAAYGGASRPATRRFARIRRLLDASTRRISGSETYRAVRQYVPELQPAWWVLRGYLAVVALAVLLRGDQNIRPIPNPFTSGGLVEIIAMVAAVVGSVRLGRWAQQRQGRATWKLRAGNVFVAVPGLIALASMSTPPSWAMDSGPGMPDAYAAAPTTNIYPYSSDGKPLQGVLLYDQDGRPLTLSPSDYGIITQYVIAADGQPVANEYPLQQTAADGTRVVPPRVAIPPASQSTSPPPASSSRSNPRPSP